LVAPPQWPAKSGIARNLALKFTSPRYIEQIAQKVTLTGFDQIAHGDTYKEVVKEKVALLEDAFAVAPSRSSQKSVTRLTLSLIPRWGNPSAVLTSGMLVF
jgi:hypothetical protein